MQFKNRIIESYNELFENSGHSGHSTKLEGFAKKWGWYQSIYGLSKGDIRKLDEITNSRLHTCLTMLAFEKDKMQVEQQLIKNAKRWNNRTATY